MAFTAWAFTIRCFGTVGSAPNPPSWDLRLVELHDCHCGSVSSPGHPDRPRVAPTSLTCAPAGGQRQPGSRSAPPRCQSHRPACSQRGGRPRCRELPLQLKSHTAAGKRHHGHEAAEDWSCSWTQQPHIPIMSMSLLLPWMDPKPSEVLGSLGI